MRSMWRGGDSLAQIASKALRRNRIGKAKVREIVFGETDAALEVTEPVETDDLADEIAEAISDTLDMDWQPSWAAPNIIAIINRVRREAADEIEVLRAELARVRTLGEAVAWAVKTAPIPMRGEEMMSFRDRSEEWRDFTKRPALAAWNAEAAR